MNIPNILALADFLESPVIEGHFNMMACLDLDVSGSKEKPLLKAATECGSAACIGGWAAVLADPDALTDGFYFSPFSGARAWLELSPEMGEDLFFPRTTKTRSRFDYDDITAFGAAQVLRHLATTGEVDFDHAFEEEE